MVDEIARQAGRPVKVRAAGKWLLRALGLFNPLMREMVEMHYLLTEPVIMDDSALPMIRDDVYRIGREALVNAFRHSGATRIEVGVETARHRLRVLVRDDGRGIDAEVLRAGRDGHWGLPGMRERSERIGGRLRVWSRPGRGTEVELSVPGRVAFRSSSSDSLWKRLRSLPRSWANRIPRSRDSSRP
jgi:signal transduction histidine kinase